mgnify:FL=1
MSYIMINGIDKPRELIFNGTQPKCLVYNGEIVWVAEVMSPAQDKMTEAITNMGNSSATNTTYTINRGEGV